MKKIAILGASLLQKSLIIKANNLGFETHVFDFDKNAIGFKYAYKKYFISTLDSEKILDKCIKNNIEGILTTASDRPMRTVSIIGEQLGLITPSEESIKNSINKNRMRDILFKNNISIPKYVSVDSKKEFFANLNNFENMIVKAADNSGKRGVSSVSINDSPEKKSQAYDYACINSSSKVVLIEEMLFGQEISVEVLCTSKDIIIVAMTKKTTTGSPEFVEIKHEIPFLCEISLLTKINEITYTTIKALGLKNCGVHLEIIIQNSIPYIIEVGPRLGGDYITSQLVPLSTGYDIEKNLLRLVMGEKIEPLVNKHDFSMIKYFVSNGEVLKEIITPFLDKYKKNIIEMLFYFKPGDKLPITIDSTSRIGHIISVFENDKTYKVFSQLLEKITIIGDDI